MSTPSDRDMEDLRRATQASRADKVRAQTDQGGARAWAPSQTEIDRAFRELRTSGGEYTRDIPIPSNADIYRALRAWRAENLSYNRKRDKARETEDWYSTGNPGFTASESFSERVGSCLCDLRMDYGAMHRLEDEMRELKRKSAVRYARLLLVIGERARLRLDVDAADPEDPEGDELRRRIDQLTNEMHGSTTSLFRHESDEPAGAPSE